MTGRITMWGAGEFLTTFFGQTTEPPGDFYFALIKDVTPTAYVSGSELDEPIGNTYTRAQIPNDGSTWVSTGQPHVVSMGVEITFPEAFEDWGTIRHWALTNAPVDGFVYCVGSLSTPLVVQAGDTVRIPDGNITVSIGPFFASEN